MLPSTEPAARRGPPSYRKKHPCIDEALIALIQDEIAGDPITGKRWIRRSLAKLQRALAQQGLKTNVMTIHRLLRKQGIHPKSNVKHLTPRPHPDRDLQFQYIQRRRRRFTASGWPILSVDCKKKELIGPFKNPGRVWSEHAPEVYSTDFPDDAVCKVTPYGVYDVTCNEGHVYVRVGGEPPDFTVAAIAHWWRHTGRRRYLTAPHLLILADGGGGNSAQSRRWKQQLQIQLADAFGLLVTVCHFPPGASKWNPIEHRLFSQISQTWAGTPLTSVDVVMSAIRATKTTTGLTVRATRFRRVFLSGVTVTDAQMAGLVLRKHRTCPQWNYTITPRKNGK